MQAIFFFKTYHSRTKPNIFSILRLIWPKPQKFKISNLQFTIFSYIFPSTKQDTTKNLHFFPFRLHDHQGTKFYTLGHKKKNPSVFMIILPFRDNLKLNLFQTRKVQISKNKTRPILLHFQNQEGKKATTKLVKLTRSRLQSRLIPLCSRGQASTPRITIHGLAQRIRKEG